MLAFSIALRDLFSVKKRAVQLFHNTSQQTFHIPKHIQHKHRHKHNCNLMKYLFLAVVALELLPPSRGFVVHRSHQSCSIDLRYRANDAQDVQVRSDRDLVEECGHSPEDEEHYHVNDHHGQKLEDDMISDAFQLMDDLVTKAEEEAMNTVIE